MNREPGRGSAAHRAGREGAFTLIEVLVALVTAYLSVIGIIAYFYTCSRTTDDTLEQVRALHALRAVAEEVRSTDFGLIVSEYRGAKLSVPGFDGACTVDFVLDETDDSELGRALGMPMDLDGDGEASNPDVENLYTLLPMRLEMTWTGSDGAERRRTLEMLMAED